MTLPHVTLYSDGGAVPNPGKGGYGIILCYKDIVKEFSQGYSLTTNNRMELSGVIAGLSKLTKKSKVDVYTDSQYTINGIQKGWAKKWKANNWMRTPGEKAVNSDLWEKLLEILEQHEVTFHWVKGHNGHPENERCDQLATLALEGENMIEDEGYKAPTTIIPLPSSPISNSPHPHTWGVRGEGENFTQETKLCSKCSLPMVKQTPKKKPKPEQKYYYEYFFRCSQCGSNYMPEEAKRENKSH